MKTFNFLIVFLLLLPLKGASSATLNQTEANAKTRILLLKMQRETNDVALKKLFEEGDERLPDLIQALCDQDKKVHLHAQVIIRYLGDPRGIEAIGKCTEAERERMKVFAMPTNFQNFSAQDGEFLKGTDKDLVKLVIQNATFISQVRPENVAAKLIAYNKSKDKALLAVFNDCVPLCGVGWHVSLKKENGKWRFLSISKVWES
jgi:hypothetical protein